VPCRVGRLVTQRVLVKRSGFVKSRYAGITHRPWDPRSERCARLISDDEERGGGLNHHRPASLSL
jgi:hypothetical protein